MFKNKGFTILEVIAAILIMAVGVLAAFSVVQRIVSSTFVATSRLQAAYLAKEGIEIVRNIRDTNWLNGRSWNNGLPTGDWEADYLSQTLTDTYDGDFLNYYSGVPSKFKRKITIDNSIADVLKVVVEIEWQEKGQTYTITAQENLYDWF